MGVFIGEIWKYMGRIFTPTDEAGSSYLSVAISLATYDLIDIFTICAYKIYVIYNIYSVIKYGAQEVI